MKSTTQNAVALIHLSKQTPRMGTTREPMLIVRDAPVVCAAPKRTHDKNKKERRTVSLYRPTASSMAKSRVKVSEEKKGQELDRKTNKKGKKSKKATSSLASPSTSMSNTGNENLRQNKVDTLCQKLFQDLSPEYRSTLDDDEKIEVNPLLIDADNITFDPYLNEMHSLSGCSTLIHCQEMEQSHFYMTRNRDNRIHTNHWADILKIPTAYACAVGFTAGVGVGMAIGACNVFTTTLQSA